VEICRIPSVAGVCDLRNSWRNREASALRKLPPRRQAERIHLTTEAQSHSQKRRKGSAVDISDFGEIEKSFTAMLALLRTEPGTTDDREGVLHRLMEDFLNQLLLLVPDSNALK